MAVSPQTLFKNLKGEADIFEEIIDNQLSKHKIYPGETVFISVPKGMIYSHFEILKKKYLQSGWYDVLWVSDQRDGDCIKFVTA
mgnify:CR=1 FL=1